jgi:O-antigen ligase
MNMDQRKFAPLVPLLLIGLALLSLMVIGALNARRAYLLRGIPDGLPPLIPAGGARLGMNVELEQYTDPELEESLNRIEALGVQAIKQTFHFSNDFNWAASDRLIQAVSTTNLELVPLLDGDPADGFAPPTDPEPFAAWVAQFAQRYGHLVHAYAIWDEPNLASHWGGQPANPAQYAVLLGAASRAIRLADPGARIVAAPLAPTVEVGPENLSDVAYLEALYAAGGDAYFDVIGAKPYGFDSGPDDRTVDAAVLNFSRVILFREVTEKRDAASTAIWAGNWGWNSLPADWAGEPSIWGQVGSTLRAEWTLRGLERAMQEWPWMGYMFLEGWEHDVAGTDPHLGFTVTGTETERALAGYHVPAGLAYPGFHPADPNDPAQRFEGAWRFSPEFGADVGENGDRASLDFWGTEVGLRVRRADNSARFHVSVDGRPANALPRDEQGAALVLNATVKGREELISEVVAANLEPGAHTLDLVAYQGWDQWALNGFSIAYRPQQPLFVPAVISLALLAIASTAAAIATGRKVSLDRHGGRWTARIRSLERRRQLALTAVAGAVVAITGWLTWGEQAAGVYRRLDGTWQLALTAAAASTFYFTPSLLVYLAALGVLFMLIYARPAWGLALIALAIPFYVKPKPLMGYRFSPVEIFLVVTVAAVLLAAVMQWRLAQGNKISFLAYGRSLKWPDWAVLLFVVVATISLFFTERLDVALNEWRVVIVEPAVFYLLLRTLRLDEDEVATIVDAFVLGGLVVALIGLGQYVTGQNLITSEAGLMRLRSVYGSPNNVALYLGRIIALCLAVALLGRGRRRRVYLIVLAVLTVATLLTLSKGAVFLGLPVATATVLAYWLHAHGRRVWPWLLGAFAAMLLSFGAALQIPELAARLDPRGDTGFIRLGLWRASLNMFRDHPLFGVGLDNFLYAYRSRYILMSAWQEPDLNHPHNVILDLATRLGAVGLLTGSLMLWALGRVSYRVTRLVPERQRALAVGLFGALIYGLAHGLVDHSLFLVDLAFAFYLLTGLSMWLWQHASAEQDERTAVR